jgi:hypothetical protein
MHLEVCKSPTYARPCVSVPAYEWPASIHDAGEVGLLQAAVTPALEDLVASSNKSNLERVRRLKAAHQRLMNRAQRVHTALQRLMGE